MELAHPKDIKATEEFHFHKYSSVNASIDLLSGATLGLFKDLRKCRHRISKLSSLLILLVGKIIIGNAECIDIKWKHQGDSYLAPYSICELHLNG